MAQTKHGAMKSSAKKYGITIDKYTEYIRIGLKHCGKCKTWRPIAEFDSDITRFDKLSPVCKFCRESQNRIGPSRRERIQKRASGIAWCRDCFAWLPLSEVSRGRCSDHWRDCERQRYKSCAEYRNERKQHAHSRKRNVAPIPPEAQQDILEEFCGKCAYCGKPATTWDHIFPVASGGRTTPGNIVPACVHCNSSKKTSDVFEWMQAKGLMPSELLIEYINQAISGLW